MEGRQTAARARAELLLNESEKQGGCLAPASSADRRVLQRLCKDEIVEPVPGVFARRSRWQALPVEERMLGVMRGLAERHPAWIFCGSSAALIHGLDVPYSLLHSIHVQAPGHAGRMPEHPRQLPFVPECRSGVRTGNDGYAVLAHGMRLPADRTVFRSLGSCRFSSSPAGVGPG